MLVPQTLENPMRRVPLLARHVRIRVRLQDRVDDAGEPVQLGPPDRLGPAVARWRQVSIFFTVRRSMPNRRPAS